MKERKTKKGVGRRQKDEERETHSFTILRGLEARERRVGGWPRNVKID